MANFQDLLVLDPKRKRESQAIEQLKRKMEQDPDKPDPESPEGQRMLNDARRRLQRT